MSVDTLDDTRAWLIRFARRMPALLGRHAVTEDLAERFDALAIERQLGRRFTLAIVGRMKAGKSTLLNALIDRSLAPVGVTELTATINWFDIARDEDPDLFHIHWRDKSRSPERRPLSRLGEFGGRSEEAAAADHLRFFVQTPFLDGVRIVDTPGYGSAMREHETVIEGYLGDDSIDEDGERQGGHADAVLLVMPHSARGIDTKALDDFQKRTRFPGQGPYNSIAVLQKWETFEGDAVAEAQRIASALKARLRGHVADVLPISGMLHQVARVAEVAHLDAIAGLACGLPAQAVSEMTQDEARFRSDPSRAALQDQLVARLAGSAGDQIDLWPILRFVLRLVQREGLASGHALRERLRHLSGVDELRKDLNRRFFKLSELIRAGAISTRALDLCEQARYRLQNEQASFAAIAREDDSIDRGLVGCRFPDPSFPLRLAAALAQHRALRDGGHRLIQATLAELDDWISVGRQHFDLLLADVAQIEELDAGEFDIEEHQAEMLRSLFGVRGIEVWQRLGSSADAHPETLRLRVDECLNAVSSLLHIASKVSSRRILMHAATRLQLLHRFLNQQTGPSNS